MRSSQNEFIINTLLNNIDLLNIPSKNTSVEKKVIGNLYNDLYISYKKVRRLMNNKKINISTIPVKTESDIPYTELLDSFFCVKQFKKNIYKKTTKIIVYTLTLKNIDITIYLNDVTNEQNITKYIMLHAISIIDLLLEYTTGTVAGTGASPKSGKSGTSSAKTKTLSIYLYLDDNEKMLPNSNIMPLDIENINTAVTYSCSEHGQILIFRKEEWLKCLIHELFHSLCLDFVSMHLNDTIKKSLKKIFCVDSEYALSETYNEWWTTNLNCLLFSFMILDKKTKKKECLQLYKVCLLTEQMFTMFQITKILNYMNMNYMMLVDKTVDSKIKSNLYKEKTNVLCYYIIKGLLLFYNNDTIKFFKQNNTSLLNFDKTPQTIKRFLKLIEEFHNKKPILNVFKKYKVFYDKIDKSNPAFKKMLNTMMMTINGV